MDKNWNYLIQQAEKFNINLNENQLGQFKKYYKFLVSYNEKVNLVSSTDEGTVITKHFIDSLSLGNLSKHLKPGKKKIIDIGIGGGFPGIPLIIAFPDWELTAVDSINKKVKFIEELCRELGLEKRVETIFTRAEDLARDEKYRENYDIAVTRAVSRLNIILEYCIPFVKPDGIFVAYKAKTYREEIEEAQNALEILNCKVELVEHYALKEEEQRSLILVRKNKQTSDKYPRKPGIPLKRPL